VAVQKNSHILTQLKNGALQKCGFFQTIAEPLYVFTAGKSFTTIKPIVGLKKILKNVEIEKFHDVY